MHLTRTQGGLTRLRSTIASIALCAIPGIVLAQTGTVTGRVTSDAAQPLAEARVFLVGTTQIGRASCRERVFTAV